MPYTKEQKAEWYQLHRDRLLLKHREGARRRAAAERERRQHVKEVTKNA
jgi:hypothetical protein